MHDAGARTDFASPCPAATSDGADANLGREDDTLPGMEGAILVVDDQEDVRDILREVLEQDGYVVYVAAGGREAIATLARMPSPRLVLLDLRMTEVSGLDVIDAMRGQPPLCRIPIVLLTAAERSISIEGVRTLWKPIRIDPLLTIVREIADPS